MHYAVLVIGPDPDELLEAHRDTSGMDQEEGICPKEPLFDWRSIGGRWCGFFRLKPGRTGWANDHTKKTCPPDHVDSALKEDIDWDHMRQHLREMAEASWQRAMAIAPGQRSLLCPSILPNERKEDYIAHASSMSFFCAILTSDTLYNFCDRRPTPEEQAEVEALIESLPGDALLTVVDCHY